MKSAVTILGFSLFTLACSYGLARAEKNPVLPPPFATPSIARSSETIGWPAGMMPTPAPNFQVSLLADLESPRALYMLPDGDILVSQAKKVPGESGEKSPNRISRLHMKGSNLVSVEPFLENIELPFGMALWKDEFFVGTPTKVLKYKYVEGKIQGEPVTIAVLPFPEPQRHWTRHLVLSDDGGRLYVSVGSASNVGEDSDPLDPRTAAILEMDRNGQNQSIVASGLRNAVSMAWEPTKGFLWATVNERDELGDNLPPDYITRILRGGFYGWPYAYWGQHEDPRRAGERLDLVKKSIVPDFAVGAHTASVGITFTSGTRLPAPFSEGALIAQHGSWNSSSLVGYRVHYVPFVDGMPIDGESEFLTGFIANEAAGKVYGRPVATLVLADGSVLVSDDGGGKIWKVMPITTAR